MSAVVNWLMTWPRERLARELFHQAKDNAALQNRVFELEHEVFWLRSAERTKEPE
jgi:hypothetical protein